MTDLSVRAEGKEYPLKVDAAGVPGVGEVLGIEVERGVWREFSVVSRRFNFGTKVTTVIVEADKIGDMAPPGVVPWDDDDDDMGSTWKRGFWLGSSTFS